MPLPRFTGYYIDNTLDCRAKYLLIVDFLKIIKFVFQKNLSALFSSIKVPSLSSGRRPDRGCGRAGRNLPQPRGCGEDGCRDNQPRAAAAPCGPGAQGGVSQQLAAFVLYVLKDII